MPSFNPLIPTVNDATLQSYFQLRANFQAINSTFAENHSALTRNPDDVGKHTTLTMQPQSGNPTTATDQVGLYSKLVTGVPELFFAPNNSQTPIQLTYPSIKVDGSNTQYSFIAGPFVVYTGLLLAVADNQLVTLTPSTTLVYVGLTITNRAIILNGAALPINIAANSFNIHYNSAILNPDIFYFVIGVA